MSPQSPPSETVGSGVPPGNDWAKYLLYADEVRRHGSLLIDNPFWMLGQPFRDDPGVPSLYGATLIMSRAPAGTRLVANPGCYPTATLLARPGTGLLRAQGVRVELVGYRDVVNTSTGPKLGKTGHVFLVIDRAQGSDLQNPATWGDGFAVDQWWASQRQQPDSPVKDPVAGSLYYDAAYFAFMGQRALAGYGELTT